MVLSFSKFSLFESNSEGGPHPHQYINGVFVSATLLGYGSGTRYLTGVVNQLNKQI